eukprot:CAMPEP_0194227968 /NCGR_PEP_ID=MMETSP0156-20130528/43129_1 /TAXON_ID=33649 /ORGANISM="Thalassionema nitzschioides, Strain L26-B" /LENGTH=483 /DNA_ID=CAMNT_0038960467 /DNA_START=75 /DNA_END=1523 /DNA_ORIENTATION=-
MSQEQEDAEATTKKEELDNNILKHSIKKLKADLAAVKQANQKMTKEHEESIDALKQESEMAIADVRNALQSEIEVLKTNLKDALEEKINSVAELEEKSANVISNLEAEMKSSTEKSSNTISEMELALSELSEKKNDLEQNLKQLQEKYDDDVEEWERKYNIIFSESKNQKLTIEEQHNEAVMLMKKDLEKKEKEAIDKIKATEVELEDKLNKIEMEAKKQLENQTGHHSKERQNLMEAMESLKDDHAKLERHITELETKYADATKEIEEWQDMFRARSYCNLTYIQEDANVLIKTTTAASIDAVSKATMIASEHAIVAQKYAQKYAKSVMERTSENAVVMKEYANQAAAKATKMAEPHVATGTEMYNKNLKPSVDKYLNPINEGYIRPALQQVQPALVQTQDLAREGLVRGQDTVIEGRSIAVQRFEAFCLGWERELVESESTATQWAHGFIREKCSNPEQSIDRFALAILLMIALFYRQQLW